MKKKINFQEYQYCIKGQRDFSLTEFMKAMKTAYEEYAVFQRNVVILTDCDEFIRENWDNIIPYTAEEIFIEQNIEKRRVLFSCLGPEKLFKSLKPKLLDRKELKKKTLQWDEKNTQSQKTYDDIYELYQIPREKLFPEEATLNASWQRTASGIYAVKCACTTTGREYWIFVDESIAKEHDAIKAIAWTFVIGVDEKDILSIYRQGDCLICHTKEDAKLLNSWKYYHMSKETYLKKLIAES